MIAAATVSRHQYKTLDFTQSKALVSSRNVYNRIGGYNTKSKMFAKIISIEYLLYVFSCNEKALALKDNNSRNL